MKKINKRVLVISNNCFSQSNSNGRTLGNLFYGWEKENLAQFCVISNDPNWDLCDNYYCLEDKTVLKAFLHCKKAEGRLLKSKQNKDNKVINTNRTKIGLKTLPKVMLRELVWGNKRWNSKSFQKWINNFNPDIVVLQVGDTCFMIELALYVAKTWQIPLLVYNTEGYYFFPRNWHSKSILDPILFPVYKHIYSKKFRTLISTACHSVYLNGKLKEDYDKEFNKPSTVIYNSSDIQTSNDSSCFNQIPSFCYLGNLGLDRDSALIEIGSILYKINPKYHINIYGAANEKTIEKFNKAVGVQYHGLVSYSAVRDIIKNSDILFHVETEKGYKERQLQYAFSGKIADSIASGKCFVLYAPKELACSKYIIETGAGWYAESKFELQNILEEIINNPDCRKSVLEKAKNISFVNHSFESNANKFQDIIGNI